eukprot:m.323860 g.323860  ORF g.323860 m.323860 type:complete len:221 (+) comp19728_c7_seq2:185-847(+)
MDYSSDEARRDSDELDSDEEAALFAAVHHAPSTQPPPKVATPSPVQQPAEQRSGEPRFAGSDAARPHFVHASSSEEEGESDEANTDGIAVGHQGATSKAHAQVRADFSLANVDVIDLTNSGDNDGNNSGDAGKRLRQNSAVPAADEWHAAEDDQQNAPKKAGTESGGCDCGCARCLIFVLVGLLDTSPRHEAAIFSVRFCVRSSSLLNSLSASLTPSSLF